MKKTTLALACALALTGAGASFAQPPAAAPGAPGPMRMQRMDPAQMQAHRAQMIERRAQRLRDALQLTQAQEPALRAFLQSAAPPADRMQRRQAQRPGPDARPATTPERLDRQRARMAERQQMFERRAEATKRFYAALTPAQQKAFDALRPMGGRRGGHGGHDGHGRGGQRGGHGMRG